MTNKNQSTEAIILKTIKYSDSSLIVKTFTPEYGIQSYMAKGIKNKKSKNKSNLFQPLSIVNIQAASGKSDLKFIREVTSAYPYQSIPFNVIKSSIVFFINEFLYNIFLAEDYTDKRLYEFIKESLIYLDSSENSVANFHISFLAHFTYFMGIFPNNTDDGRFFDLTGGSFTHRAQQPFLDTKTSEYFKQLLEEPIPNAHLIKLPTYDKNQLLNGMLNYYKIHVEGFRELESYPILKTILSD